MANFHVGQRVKIVRQGAEKIFDWLIGAEGTFVCYGSSSHLPLRPPEDCCVLIDGLSSGFHDGSWGMQSSCLAPLTDPSAERFIESIKKLGREPINDAPKVEVTK